MGILLPWYILRMGEPLVDSVGGEVPVLHGTEAYRITAYRIRAKRITAENVQPTEAEQP